MNGNAISRIKNGEIATALQCDRGLVIVGTGGEQSAFACDTEIN